MVTGRCTLLLAVLFFRTGASPEECNCEAACAQIVARQREEIVRLQAELRAARGSADPPARQAAAAEPLCGGEWEVTTIADLEPLQGCRSVGNLTISNVFQLTKLVGLENLETAENLLIKDNFWLQSLVGLEGLTRVRQKLDISENTWLGSLGGLQSLERVGSLNIVSNGQIKSLAGLENLEASEQLSIEYNGQLESLSALEKLTHVRQLWLHGNSGLKSLAGLQSLEDAELVDIDGNAQLESLAGFNLTRVGKLYAWRNDRLTSLAGLQNLETAGIVSIRDNGQLESLDGLERLMRVEQRLAVRENSRLKSLDGLRSLKDAEEVHIDSNAQLESLVGFETLARVGQLKVFSNEGLKSLAGLQSLEDAEEVDIKSNVQLESLVGLETLVRVGSLQVRSNRELKSLTGLRSLENAGLLNIYENAQLVSLVGCEALAHVEELYVYGNQGLTNLTGLEHLKNAWRVAIEHNEQLDSLHGLEGLTRVEGTLRVSDSSGLKSLAGLESLKNAEWVNITGNAQLESLTGLETLARVGLLSVWSNDGLTSLTGLQSLETAGKVEIVANGQLESLAGLGNLTSVVELRVTSNAQLESLGGLERLTSVEQLLYIVHNSGLKSLDGLRSLKDAEVVHIDSNAQLESLVGFETLARVGLLKVFSNEGLKSLAGLQSLEDADGVDIKSNGQLESLVGLETLVRAGSLQVRSNLRLKSLTGLRSLESAGLLNIYGNAQLVSLVGCEALAHVEELYVYSNQGLTNLTGLERLKNAGRVEIEHNEQLDSLHGLEGLTRVEGTLRVSHSSGLKSLAGLESLKNADWVEIMDNNHLESLVGLQSLETAGVLVIEGNGELESLDGLERLARLERGLDIKRSGRLQSLTGLDNLTHVGVLNIDGNAKLKSVAGLQSLRTAVEIFFNSNDELKTLTGLESLTHVENQFFLAHNTNLASLSGLQSLESAGGALFLSSCHKLENLTGLESLTRVGKLELLYLEGLRSLAGLRGLTSATNGVFVESCDQLRSLEGLGALDKSSGLVVEWSRELEYLGAPFGIDASIGVVRFDERSWPDCMFPHERMALLSVITDMNASSVPTGTKWDPSCGPNFGTFSCTRGETCSVSLGEGTNFSTIYVSSRFTSCRACSGPHPQGNVVKGDVAGDGSVDFGYALRGEEAGLHSICSCGANETRPVAQLLLRGPWPSDPTPCSRGRDCTIRVDGEGLEPTDQVVVMSSCSGDPRHGFPASWTAEREYLLHDRTWYAASPAFYEVCWRVPCTGSTCPAPEDSYIHVGEVQLLGAYRRNYTTAFGAEFFVPNIGLGVADGDQMRLRRACGEANEEGTGVLAANSSRMVFDFGRLTEAGVYHLCWCHERDGAKCNAERHFLADAGVVRSLCPAGEELVDSRRCKRCPAGKQQLQPGLQPCAECPTGQFSPGGTETCKACPDGTVASRVGTSACLACSAWQSADAEAEGCSPDPARLVLLSACCLFVGAFCAALAHGTKRRLSVVDVSVVEGHTVVTTSRSHWLANLGRKSFPVTFHGTGHPGLDSPAQAFRARVMDALRLELLTSANQPIKGRLDTSMGTLTVAFPSDFRHQGIVVVGLPALFTAFAVLGALALLAGMGQELLLGAAAAALACTTGTVALRRRPRATPLDQRLSAFKQKLATRPRKAQWRCAKGPDRAIAIGKLHELLQFFHDFIQDRTAYYLDTNIIQPLTKEEKVSYAEFVGAERVEWFVSHFWGTPFEHFCAALKKHAQTVCGQREWTRLPYWVCFCSNNQHQIQQELGEGWHESSFYLTLRSGDCRGTCMVLDDKALPLTRIWCIFELLQTVKLEHSAANFQGLLLCTSGGVLNTGGGSAEVAVALAEKVSEMNLATAQASSAKDATMIRNQVKEEMGSFAALNRFICSEMRRMLVRAQQGADQHFAAVLAHLDHAIEENNAKELFPDVETV